MHCCDCDVYLNTDTLIFAWEFYFIQILGLLFNKYTVEGTVGQRLIPLGSYRVKFIFNDLTADDMSGTFMAP